MGLMNVTAPAPPAVPSLASWLFGSGDDEAEQEEATVTQQVRGCEVRGEFHEVGAIVGSSSGPCLQCR